jgi:hypothetical protein
MESWPATDPEPLGTIDDLKKSLSGLFPDIHWEHIQGTWFGRYENGDRYAEFQISTEDDGKIRFLSVRRTERHEVETLSRHLGVVAVDSQRMELYSNVTGRWSAAG